MPWVTKKIPLTLNTEEQKHLETLSQSRTASLWECQQARILLAYSMGTRLRTIAREVGVSRMTDDKCLDKALSMGVAAGLRTCTIGRRNWSSPRTPRPGWSPWPAPPPKDLGMAAELWTRSALAAYVRIRASAAGHPYLAKAA